MAVTYVSEQEELDVLTPKDLKTILDVYERSLEAHPDLPGLVSFQGPEVIELFTGELADDMLRAFTENVGVLGRTQSVQAQTANGPSGQAVRHKRLFERLFMGSPRYPDGVAVGVRLRSTKASDGTFKVDNSLFDIDMEQRHRLRSIAYGTRYLTTPQRREDTNRKDAARRMASTPDAAILTTAFQQMIASAGMAQSEARVPQPATLETVPALTDGADAPAPSAPRKPGGKAA